MIRRAAAVLISLLGLLSMKGQTASMLREQAYIAAKDKDWYGASQYYARLYDIDSNDVKLRYRYAEASRQAYDLDVALKLYLKVAETDNGKRYPLTFYWIGQILKSKQQYKLAKLWFLKFNKLKIRSTKLSAQEQDYYKTKSRLEADACDLAQIYINDPVAARPESMDAVINTTMSEYAAFEKDSTLYFSSIRAPERRRGDKAVSAANERFYSKIYRSDIRKEKYKKVKALDTTINSNIYHAANTTFSPDNKTMVFSRCTALNAGENLCELYQSTYIKPRWLSPSRLPKPVNQPSVSTTQPHFSTMEGKTVLFFSSNREGGEGGMDIWYSYRDENGRFSKPVNAGRNVNTPDDEISPWYVPSDSILYFSSTYHQGLGGFDIFKSQFKNGNFQAVQNAGYPINSPHNDTYFSLNEAGTRAYLSSNRTGSLFEGKMNCCSDIYRYVIDTTRTRVEPVDTTKIIKEQLRLLVPLTLYFHNDEPDPRTTNTVTSKNYVRTFEEYKALAPLYEKEYTAGLKGDDRELALNQIRNFFSDSVDGGLEGLERFADLLEKVLKKGETVRITMKGYCSPLASTDYNIKLAKRRISSLRNYFKETRNGLFLPYINNPDSTGGRMILEDVDIGELPTTRASDNFRDKRNSVFSPFAASERKIQIIAISYGNSP